MSARVVQLWQQLLDRLLHVADGGITGLAGCNDLLKELYTKMPQQPASTWRALIQDMQLPRKLGLLGCALLADEPYKAGPMLPAALANTMAQLLGHMVKAGVRSGGQLEHLWTQKVLPQMTASGFFRCLDRLLEATAEQLERCTAAAAAADDSRAGLAAAATVATASILGLPAGANLVWLIQCLNALHSAAGRLLNTFTVLHTAFVDVRDLHGSAQNIVSKLGAMQAAAAHLMLASMRHISSMMQLYMQLQSLDIPNDLAGLAGFIAEGTMVVANFTNDHYAKLGHRVFMGRGVHFVPWSDMTLLLSTYASILKQQGQLPSVMGSSSSSSSSSSSRHSNQQRQTSVPAAVDAQHASAQAAWQEVHDQWVHVPRSHQQLLELLGVSPAAALWLAQIMVREDLGIPTPSACWSWNPHNIATAADAASGLLRVVPSASTEKVDMVFVLQAQLLQWVGTPLSALLQLVLLYGTLHVALSNDEFICCCWEVIDPMLRQRFRKGLLPNEQDLGHAGSSSSSSGSSRGVCPLVHVELLLLTSQLMWRLQQQRFTASVTSSAPAAATPGQRKFPNAADRESYIDDAEIAGIEALLMLAAFVQVYVQDEAGPAVAGTAAAQAAAAATRMSPFCPGACARAALFAGSGTLCSVFECFMRAKGSMQLCLSTIAPTLAFYCCSDASSKPGLLLRLAQSCTGEQQAAFFNLCVTLLKLSATAAYSGVSPVGGHCRATIAIGAVRMLGTCLAGSKVSSAAAVANVARAPSSSSTRKTCAESSSSSSSEMSAAPWLLVLGRCCSQWAAELAQMQAEGARWAYLIRRANKQPKAGDGMPLATTLYHCFANSCPKLLSSAKAMLACLGEGSSISQSLAAAGYDTAAVLQAFAAVAACYPGVLDVSEPADVIAGNVAGLINALEAVGRACSVFATPYCCNNPACSNLAGSGELSVVSGKGCICGGCEVARYCGKGCQKPHWKQHKPVCKALRAAATAQQHG